MADEPHKLKRSLNCTNAIADAADSQRRRPKPGTIVVLWRDARGRLSAPFTRSSDDLVAERTPGFEFRLRRFVRRIQAGQLSPRIDLPQDPFLERLRLPAAV